MGKYSRIGRGRGRRGNSSSFFSIVLSLLLAITIGYVGTKYIIYPLVLQDKGEEQLGNKTGNSLTVDNPITNPAIEPTTDSGIETSKTVVEDQQEVKDVNGYSLQYGVFTDKTQASNMVLTLSQKGANAYIFETATEYKVLGNAYVSEEKANTAAEILKNNGAEVSVVEY